jgi:hypothetical protein
VLLAETASILVLFARGRWKLFGALFFLGFHLLTYLTITIHFLPTVICWLAFCPLERLGLLAGRLRGRTGGWPGGRPGGAAGAGTGRQHAGGGTAGETVPVAGDEPVPEVR